MRRRLVPATALAVLAAAGLAAFPATPHGAGDPPGDGAPPALPLEQRIRLEEAFHLARALGPEIWPGFDGRGAPVLLLTGQHEFLLNRREAPAGFRPSGDDPFLGRPVFVRSPRLSPRRLATFPALGFETVVVGTAEQVGRSPAHWVVTVGHELFHVFQAARGLNDKVTALAIGPPDDPSWHLEFPFPYQDEPVRHAMHLLGYSLFRASAHPGPEDASALAYEARAAAEAMGLLDLVLTERHGDPRHLKYLRYQTAKEGVARYVEYRLAREAASGGYRPTGAFRAAEGAGAYRSLWEESYKSLLYQVKHLGSVSRSRLEFYSLGLGMALALDGLGTEWREAYFAPGVWLDGLLREAAGPAPAGRTGKGCPTGRGSPPGAG